MNSRCRVFGLWPLGRRDNGIETPRSQKRMGDDSSSHDANCVCDAYGIWTESLGKCMGFRACEYCKIRSPLVSNCDIGLAASKVNMTTSEVLSVTVYDDHCSKFIYCSHHLECHTGALKLGKSLVRPSAFHETRPLDSLHCIRAAQSEEEVGYGWILVSCTKKPDKKDGRPIQISHANVRWEKLRVREG